MTTAEALDLIDQFVDAGVVDLAVSGGEPLLRKDLFEIVGYARRRGMTVGVGSNGAALSERHAGALAVAGVGRVQISLDGLAGAHEKLRCWPGLFKRAVQALETLAAAGLRTHVCCTIQRLNVDELEAFTEFVATTVATRLNFSRYIPTGRQTDGLDLADTEWRAVVHRCADLRRRYRGRLDVVTHLAQEVLVDPDVARLPSFAGCQAGRAQGCVTANGTVLPCVLLPVPVGNIREKSFRDIWTNSPVVQSLQARHLKGECGVCDVQNRCGGCRAVAFAKTGDYLAADPRCWLTSVSRRRGVHGEDQEVRS